MLYYENSFFKRRWRTSAVLQQLFERTNGLISPTAVVYAAGCSKTSVVVEASEMPSQITRPVTMESSVVMNTGPIDPLDVASAEIIEVHSFDLSPDGQATDGLPFPPLSPNTAEYHAEDIPIGVDDRFHTPTVDKDSPLHSPNFVAPSTGSVEGRRKSAAKSQQSLLHMPRPTSRTADRREPCARTPVSTVKNERAEVFHRRVP